MSSPEMRLTEVAQMEPKQQKQFRAYIENQSWFESWAKITPEALYRWWQRFQDQEVARQFDKAANLRVRASKGGTKTQAINKGLTVFSVPETKQKPKQNGEKRAEISSKPSSKTG